MTNGWGKNWCPLDESQSVWEMKIRAIDIVAICKDCESITTSKPVPLEHLNLGFNTVVVWEVIRTNNE